MFIYYFKYGKTLNIALQQCFGNKAQEAHKRRGGQGGSLPFLTRLLFHSTVQYQVTELK